MGERAAARAAGRVITDRAQRALIESLEWLCGPLAMRRVVDETLAEARLDALPKERDALLTWVREHVVPLLHDALGPHEAAEFLTRFLAAMDGVSVAEDEEVEGPPLLTPSSGLRRVVKPSMGPGVHEAVPRQRLVRRAVLLVCSDRLERLWLARMLVRAAFDVVVVERFVDLATLSGALPALALVDMASAQVGVLLEGMALRRPDIRVVAVGEGDADALLRVEEALLRVRIYRFEVQSSETRGAELAAALRRQAED